ncbi:MAG: hypothetical protein KGL39_15380 [Patescibacteria group bacterium]|nr:hypothetical protein [Patescibacteria group bacterium]
MSVATTAQDVRVAITGTIVINGVDIPFTGTALIPKDTPITLDINADLDSNLTVD